CISSLATLLHDLTFHFTTLFRSVAGVNTHGVEVFDGAHDHDVVVGVAHQLQLVLLPPEDGFLQKHLGGRGQRKSLSGDTAQFLLVVGKARARPSHGEGGTYNDRVGEFLGGVQAFLEGLADTGSGGLPTDPFDDLFEALPVLAGLDRVDVGTDQLDVVLGENARLVQVDGGVERGLPAQGGKEGIGAFLGEDLLDHLRCDRFDVGCVGDLRVGHDRCRVGVDQDDPETLGLEDTAGLGARVVELGGLPDHDRPGADHQDGRKVTTARHALFSSYCSAAGAGWADISSTNSSKSSAASWGPAAASGWNWVLNAGRSSSRRPSTTWSWRPM